MVPGSSAAELKAALSAAKAGDVMTLALGTYAEGLSGTALGELLLREGLYEEQLRAWRAAAAGALDSAEAAPVGPATAVERRKLKVANKRVKELEKELRRKEKALAEAAALLVFQKKLQALGWNDGDDGTDEGSEK